MLSIVINFIIRDGVTFQQLSRVIVGTLLIVLSFYLIGYSAASMDRRAGVATAKLPTWCRLILFFNQPNPFRKRTVFFQTYVVLGLLITFGDLFFGGSKNIVINIIIRWHTIGMLILIAICDIKLRRAIRNPSTPKQL